MFKSDAPDYRSLTHVKKDLAEEEKRIKAIKDNKDAIFDFLGNTTNLRLSYSEFLDKIKKYEAPQIKNETALKKMDDIMQAIVKEIKDINGTKEGSLKKLRRFV